MDLQPPSLLCSHAYIDGAWVGKPTLPVLDKATGGVFASVPDLGADETRAAVEAAQRAFPGWSRKLAKERSAILRRWHDLVIAHADDLALILTREQGKPLKEARGEILYGASFIEWFAEEAKRIRGETLPSHKADARIVILRQPVGVVAAITPWNFPNAMITRKVSPALAAGCTVVVKPAEDTPLSALALAALAEEAGLPKGVLNVVTARDPIPVGEVLTTHPAVRAVTFTGSTEVGKILMRQASSTVKKVALELGGNAPFVVFDDADVDKAVAGAMASKFRNAGQTCVCANRIYVEDGIYDAFASRLAAAARDLVVGPGTQAGVDIGPLINAAAVAKVEEHVRDAIGRGARAITGAAVHAAGATYYCPTVLADVTADMRIAQEETFGPVAPLFRFRGEEEVIRAANDTRFGLAAYFYTRDVGRAWRVAEALEFGMVGVNEGVMSTELAPFGGVKESGLGREGGHHGIDEFVETKYVLMGGL
ncbi:MAG: NAD-dependent succinate-semialdehyde dehydrogenase [Hyphomicrobiaceae bacterium]|nr:NAD-dependent succinate-semialdehyde dehydrogenase [Hyphomicrobiaceae bacterium]